MVRLKEAHVTQIMPFSALKHAVSEGLKVPGPREAAVKGYLTSLLDVLENVRVVWLKFDLWC